MTDIAHARPASRLNPRSLLVQAVLCVISLGMLYPLLWMLASSFRPNNEIVQNASLWPSDFSLNAYISGWKGLDVTFGTFFLNSAVIAVLSVIGNVASCSVTAFAFARLDFPLKNLWFTLMLGTLMLPYHVILIPQYVLFVNIGWVNTFLPLVVPKFLALDSFFIFLMYQFFRAIPAEIDEAARVDGAGPWRIFLSIILPMSTPVLATAAIFSFLWTWDDFFGPVIYLNDMGRYTVQLGLRSFIDSSSGFDYSGLFAMSVLVLLPSFLLFVFFQRALIDGISTTGLK